VASCVASCDLSLGLPVCGVDGVTYQVACLALCQNVTVASAGACQEQALGMLNLYSTTQRVSAVTLLRCARGREGE
jgi:hypothetical protein